MFKVGEKVFYPYYGVTNIKKIVTEGINGKREKYYLLFFPVEDMKVMVPVKKAEEIGLRKPISRKEANELLEMVRETAAKQFEELDDSRLVKKIEGSDAFDVAEALCVLLAKQNNRTLGWLEKGSLKKGLAVLGSEVAVAKRIKEREARKMILDVWRKYHKTIPHHKPKKKRKTT